MLELPHHSIALGASMHIAENEQSEFEQFSQAITPVERSFDFVVIDTPGTDCYLMRLAHSMADTLITPINDSFVDFDVLGTVDPATYWVTGESHYAKMVREVAASSPPDRRRHDRLDRGPQPLSLLSSRNKQLVAEGLKRWPPPRLPLRSTALPNASSTANCSRAD